jgi:molybdenum cofactor cytidylyltransferase
MISCVLLSAGESRRFGSPKALAKIGQETAIERIQNTLIKSNIIDEIIVVLGAEAERISPYVFNHKKLRLVHNKDFKLGQTSSVQAGISNIEAFARGIMLFPVDCPLIKPETIEEVSHFFIEKNPSILVPVYQSQKGHPPIFNIALKRDILDLPVEKGLNSLFIGHSPVTIETQDPGVLKTFNTPEEFKRILK